MLRRATKYQSMVDREQVEKQRQQAMEALDKISARAQGVWLDNSIPYRVKPRPAEDYQAQRITAYRRARVGDWRTI